MEEGSLEKAERLHERPDSFKAPLEATFMVNQPIGSHVFGRISLTWPYGQSPRKFIRTETPSFSKPVHISSWYPHSLGPHWPVFWNVLYCW